MKPYILYQHSQSVIETVRNRDKAHIRVLETYSSILYTTYF